MAFCFLTVFLLGGGAIGLIAARHTGSRRGIVLSLIALILGGLITLFVAVALVLLFILAPYR